METLETILPNSLKKKVRKLPNNYIINLLENGVKIYEEAQHQKDSDTDFIECAKEALASLEAKKIFEKFDKNYDPSRTFSNTIKI